MLFAVLSLVSLLVAVTILIVFVKKKFFPKKGAAKLRFTSSLAFVFGIITFTLTAYLLSTFLAQQT